MAAPPSPQQPVGLVMEGEGDEEESLDDGFNWPGLADGGSDMEEEDEDEEEEESDDESSSEGEEDDPYALGEEDLAQIREEGGEHPVWTKLATLEERKRELAAVEGTLAKKKLSTRMKEGWKKLFSRKNRKQAQPPPQQQQQEAESGGDPLEGDREGGGEGEGAPGSSSAGSKKERRKKNKTLNKLNAFGKSLRDKFSRFMVKTGPKVFSKPVNLGFRERTLEGSIRGAAKTLSSETDTPNVVLSRNLEKLGAMTNTMCDNLRTAQRQLQDCCSLNHRLQKLSHIAAFQMQQKLPSPSSSAAAPVASAASSSSS